MRVAPMGQVKCCSLRHLLHLMIIIMMMILFIFIDVEVVKCNRQGKGLQVCGVIMGCTTAFDLRHRRVGTPVIYWLVSVQERSPMTIMM